MECTLPNNVADGMFYVRNDEITVGSFMFIVADVVKTVYELKQAFRPVDRPKQFSSV